VAGQELVEVGRRDDHGLCPARQPPLTHQDFRETLLDPETSTRIGVRASADVRGVRKDPEGQESATDPHDQHEDSEQREGYPGHVANHTPRGVQNQDTAVRPLTDTLSECISLVDSISVRRPTMSVERWSPFRGEVFRELLKMQNQMNRVFDDFSGNRARPSPVLERVWAPPIDVYETKDDLVVTAELPGVKEKDVRLSIVEDVLSFRGHRGPASDAKEESYHRIERRTGNFERHIQLPIPVQGDRVRATYRDGILEIRLPKVEQIKPREIKIEVG
jgi:HSP20 family protein